MVDLAEKDRFENLLRNQGFVHANFALLKFPFVDHFYGYDEETGIICHLHIYYKLVTGETHLKSYHLPFEREVIGNRFLNSYNVYEASYHDQAQLYTLRHYIKRASLISFLFWAYGKNDYLDEYAYICKGLRSACDSTSVSVKSPLYLHPELDFHHLDMGISVSEYRKAKRIMSSIGCYRRYHGLRASWMSMYNLCIRLLYKAFCVRKRTDRGLLMAISGVDGSGKSSMVHELESWFSRYFDTKVVHLGKPSPVFITLPIRPLLYMYRLVKGLNRDQSVDKTNCSGVNILESKNGLIWCIRYLALAYERYRLACRAQKLSLRGKVVLCDRYPTLSLGKMDSPRIDARGQWFVEKMGAFELHLYEKVPKADVVVFLDVSQEVAIKRNKTRGKKDKETDDEIISRHNDNQRLNFCAHQVILVDANCEYGSVLKRLKSIAWEGLLRNNYQEQ